MATTIAAPQTITYGSDRLEREPMLEGTGDTSDRVYVGDVDGHATTLGHDTDDGRWHAYCDDTGAEGWASTSGDALRMLHYTRLALEAAHTWAVVLERGHAEAVAQDVCAFADTTGRYVWSAHVEASVLGHADACEACRSLA